MLIRSFWAIFLLTVAGASPETGTAQIRFEGIDVSGGYGGWAGSDFRDVEGGLRASVTPLLRLGEFWQVGLEGVWAEDEVQLLITPIALTETGVNGVVRRRLGDSERAHVFTQARAGWTRLDSEIADGEDGSLNTYSQSGFTVGAEVGVSLQAGRYADLLWAGGVAWNGYGECEVFGPSGEYVWVDFGDACSAARWTVRVGLVLGRNDG